MRSSSLVIVECVLFVVLGSNYFAAVAQQTYFRHEHILPAQTLAVLQINDFQSVVNEARRIVDELDPTIELQSLVCSEPFPLMTDEQFKHFEEVGRMALLLVDEIEMVTVFATTIKPTPVIGIVLSIERESTSSSECITQIKAAIENVLDSGQWTEAEKELSDLIRTISSQLVIRTMDNYIVLATSVALADQIEFRLKNNGPEKPDDVITTQRRYQRAMTGLDKHEEYAILSFVSQTDELPFPDSEFARDTAALGEFGYGELVGLALGISINSNATPDQPTITARLTVPFTIPASGIVSLWQAYQPIEVVPPVEIWAARSKNELRKIQVSSMNRDTYLQNMEDMYTAAGQKDEFDQRMAQRLRANVSSEVYRSAVNGHQVDIWSSNGTQAYNGTVLLNYRQIGKPELLDIYVDSAVKRIVDGTTFAFVQSDFNGFECWFLSDADARKRAEREIGRKIDKPEEFSHSNYGYGVDPNWLLFGTKDQVQAYMEEVPKTLQDARSALESVFPGARLCFQWKTPVWLSLQFSNYRRTEALRDLRYAYLSKIHGEDKALEMVLSAAVEELDNTQIPVTTRGCRAYILFEKLVHSLFSRYAREAATFSCGNDSFAWSWMAFGPIKPE